MTRGRCLQVIGTSWAMPMHVLPLARALAADGWEVDVACPAGPETAALAGTGVGHVPVELVRRPLSPRQAAAVAALVRAIRRGRYTVVHVHGTIPGAVGRVAARLAGVPAVYHCRASLFPDPSLSASENRRRRAYPAFERLLAPGTARVVAINPEDADDFVRRVRLPEERVWSTGVGGCGLDLARWDPARFPVAERGALRAALGVPRRGVETGVPARVAKARGRRHPVRPPVLILRFPMRESVRERGLRCPS